MKKSGLGSIPKSLSWIDEVEPVEQPKQTKKELTPQANVEPKSTEKGLSNGWTRATFIVERDLTEKIKALAYWDRLTVKEVVHEAFTQYLQGKTVKPIPKKK